MNNKRIKELEDTNKLLASVVSFLLMGEAQYLVSSCKIEGEDEQEVKKYIKVLKKYIRDLKNNLENTYNVIIK